MNKTMSQVSQINCFLQILPEGGDSLMKKFYLTLIVILSILVVNTCSQKTDIAADNATLDNVTKITIQASNEGNIENHVALIADDALWMPPGVGALVGKDAIRDWHKGVESRNQFDIDIITESTDLHGQFAFQRQVLKGFIIPKQGGEPLRHNAMTLNVLHKQADGTWKI
ncbi:MAG: YybH family protein [Candidatus Hodarchaeota archaeon]